MGPAAAGGFPRQEPNGGEEPLPVTPGRGFLFSLSRELLGNGVVGKLGHAELSLCPTHDTLAVACQLSKCLLVALSGHQSQRRYMSALGGKADIPIMAQLVPLRPSSRGDQRCVELPFGSGEPVNVFGISALHH